MNAFCRVGIVALSATISCTAALAQAPVDPTSSAPQSQATLQPALNSSARLVDLNWTPPALAQLSDEASTRSSFTLDRTALALAAGLVPDSEPETRQAIAKLDGVSVHILRFAPGGVPYGASVDEVRQAYHLRGWKHLVTNNTALGANPNPKGPLHNGTTDLWVVMDGVNVRGAVALVESPKSLTLITLAGNISPMDMLHLRGHFGIPRFDGDQFNAAGDKQ
jgi:hypothetical protein